MGTTVKGMVRMQTIRLALLVLCLSIVAAAQTSSPPDTAPAPAFGQNAPVLNPDNPPVSGVDEPSLELRTAARSFISPGLQLSESVDSNANNNLGSSDLASISRILGAFDLQKFWPKSDLFLEYVGGGAVYSNPYQLKQLHAAGIEGVTRWRTGQATLRDSFSYLPDGSFNLGFGGLPGFGIATGTGMTTAVPGILHPGTLGAVGNNARLANSAILDAVQAINPVSAFTVVGAFSNAHFYDPTKTLINSDQITVEGGYSHLLNRRDQIGVIYAFQLFQFPQATGGQIYNHVVNIRYSHTITGRLSFLGGIGPQYTELEQGGSFKNWSISARAQLRYKFAHSSMNVSYEKLTSPGSGFFAGASTQDARLGYTRPLGRTWDFYGNLGYSHSKKLQDVTIGGLSNASSYDEGSVMAVLRKHLGRTYEFFTAYRFSEVGFNAPGNAQTCIANSCGRTSQRQSGTIGVEWHPTPTRIE
jgi:hypothetical protein